MDVAIQVRHARAGWLQFAVTGPAGKPETDGTSSMQMLQLRSSSLVGVVSVEPPPVEPSASKSLLRVMHGQRVVL